MRWIGLFFPLLIYGAQIQENLKALQQIRDLVPERIWYEEFNILVDRKGFKKSLCDHRSHKKGGDPVFGIACPQGYFMQSTFSGQTVRLLDLYQQFQFSPFWKSPRLKEKLESIERQILHMKPLYPDEKYPPYEELPVCEECSSETSEEKSGGEQ